MKSLFSSWDLPPTPKQHAAIVKMCMSLGIKAEIEWLVSNRREARDVIYRLRAQLEAKKAIVKVATGTCYEDAWRFQMKNGGVLVHGSIQVIEGARIKHAWVESTSDLVFEPQTRQVLTRGDFNRYFHPLVDNKYTLEEAVIRLAREGAHGAWGSLEFKKGNKGQLVTGNNGDNEGASIAQALNVHYNGIQWEAPGVFYCFLFTDPSTGTTFAGRDLDTANKRLVEVRKQFGVT